MDKDASELRVSPEVTTSVADDTPSSNSTIQNAAHAQRWRVLPIFNTALLMAAIEKKYSRGSAATFFIESPRELLMEFFSSEESK